MSIYTARFRETVTLRRARVSNVRRQRDAFSSPALTRSDSTAGSRNEPGSDFQAVGPIGD